LRRAIDKADLVLHATDALFDPILPMPRCGARSKRSVGAQALRFPSSVPQTNFWQRCRARSPGCSPDAPVRPQARPLRSLPQGGLSPYRTSYPVLTWHRPLWPVAGPGWFRLSLGPGSSPGWPSLAGRPDGLVGRVPPPRSKPTASTHCRSACPRCRSASPPMLWHI